MASRFEPGSGAPWERVPVLRPTMEQFQDFNAFVKKIERQFTDIGLAKIIPPAEWVQQVNRSLDYQSILSDLQIDSPIRQHVVPASKSPGVFKVTNIEEPSLVGESFRAIAVTEEAPPQFVNWVMPCTDDSSTEPTPGVREIEKLDSYDCLEAMYWRTVQWEPPIYGADVPGSIFGDLNVPWNVSKLPSLLDCLPEKVLGVNSPYLYFGSWKSMFPWHTEDMDLYSINYIHLGEPKQWYVVPPRFADKFLEVCKKLYPDESKFCGEFLRHKSCLISPVLLRSLGIPVYQIRHYAGEFIITWPRAYHSGFNFGWNCAESVNFATQSWIDCGKAASYCRCSRESVRIDMNMFKEWIMTLCPHSSEQHANSEKKRKRLHAQDLADHIRKFSRLNS
eukprot:TRINITY_DN9318_c0_g1_i2.p1 TRINITY_DN9318_c0_g1~~TRINITY_DN9318_c0_g1_i2.p1  ORF type:complete len:406 (-),score=58.87 TRINITY_DN9318_c0_g1_i2:538-1713(-)